MRATGATADEPEGVLVRIRDRAGRPWGSGFVADDRGTVLTSRAAVTGIDPLVLHGPGRVCEVGPGAVTVLGASGLALVRTGGADLGLPPLPVAARERIAPGTYVRLAARGWRQARVLRAGPELDLAIGTDGRDALLLGGETRGGPVLDAETGAVLAVLDGGPRAVPLRAVEPDRAGELAELLARNAATVPAHGTELNLAGALRLTGITLGAAGGALWGAESGAVVERAAIVTELACFEAGAAPVCALVGRPGTGRTTELAAWAGRRVRSGAPAPTVWLRGADLMVGDRSVGDAVARALGEAERILADGGPGAGDGVGEGEGLAERVARLAAGAGRPLLVVLDAPEEMPGALGRVLDTWWDGSVGWLRDAAARLAVGCRPEFWERVGFPEAVVVGLGDLAAGEAERARRLYGVPDGAVAVRDAGHPLTLRLLGEVRAAGVTAGCPGRDEVFAAYLDLVCLRIAARLTDRGTDGGAGRRAGPSGQAGEVWDPGTGSAGDGDPYGRYPSPGGPAGGSDADRAEPAGGRGAGAREGRGRGGGAGGGAGVAAEEFGSRGAGALGSRGAGVPGGPGAGAGAGWGGRQGAAGAGEYGVPGRAYGTPGGERGVRAAGSRRMAAQVAAQVHEAARRCLGPGRGALDRAAFEALFPRDTGWADAVLAEGLIVPAGAGHRFAHEALADWLQGAHLDVPAALRMIRDAGPGSAGVVPERLGVLVEGLLALRGERLVPLLAALAGQVRDGTAGEARWWAVRLLRETLPRLADLTPYEEVLRALARVPCPGLGGRFWERLQLPEAYRLDLLRGLVPGDGPPGAPDRYLDAVARRLTADPRTVQPLLCGWFTDETPLAATPGATVATAAQALLHTHRCLAVDDLAEALVERAHPRADELLAALAEEEPSALCRAVDRWAHDARPERRVAAAAYGLATAPYAVTPADRALLGYAARALLTRPEETGAHGTALARLALAPAVPSAPPGGGVAQRRR
ncbi:serine protease [Streptomyces sp. NPDC101118]|uniref:serine protease n=1 Tax=Streptomyces sp. NPDC101118 TaxID=3366109 RepID=UPI0037F8A295